MYGLHDRQERDQANVFRNGIQVCRCCISSPSISSSFDPFAACRLPARKHKCSPFDVCVEPLFSAFNCSFSANGSFVSRAFRPMRPGLVLVDDV